MLAQGLALLTIGLAAKITGYQLGVVLAIEALLLAIMARLPASQRLVLRGAAAIAGLRKWRGSAADDQPAKSELLTKFRELHARGGLSDDEYRTIKTKLAAQLDTELNNTKDST